VWMIESLLSMVDVMFWSRFRAESTSLNKTSTVFRSSFRSEDISKR
jgi:hypothetical protein